MPTIDVDGFGSAGSTGEAPHAAAARESVAGLPGER